VVNSVERYENDTVRGDAVTEALFHPVPLDTLCASSSLVIAIVQS